MSDAGKKKKTEISFNEVLKALVDIENFFPAGYIHKLSDLNKKEIDELEAIWGKIPLERRRSLLEDMEEFAASDFLLNFSPVAHLALDDVDGRVRTFSLQILKADEEPANVPIFLKMMNHDPDEFVRAAAAAAFIPLVYAGEIEEFSSDLLHVIEEALLTKLSSKDSDEVRRRALEALGYSSRPEVPDLISEAYRQGTQNWLISALFAMGHTTSTEWSPEVLAALRDQRPLVRAEAAVAAGELELSESAPFLLGLLDDASPEVRAACIWSLSKIGGDGVRERLEQLLDESEDDEELDLIEEALENLDFNEKFLPVMLDVDGMDDEEFEEYLNDFGDDDDDAPSNSRNSRRKRLN